MGNFKLLCLLSSGIFAVNAWAQCKPAALECASGSQAFEAVANIAVNSENYILSGGGAVIYDTAGTGSASSIGYARLQASTGSTPAAYLTFQFRENNILVGQASVPATVATQSGRIYAEVGGPVNTGIAISNPNSSPVTIAFYFTDTTGLNFGDGSLTIAANAQIAKFLTEAPFNAGDAIRGTMTFTSSLPVGVIALRGFTNERSEFLITTLPVTTNLTLAASGTVYIPHFADGGGWTTQVILVNPTDQPLYGAVQFYSQGSVAVPGQPITLIVESQAAATFPYTIPGRSSVRLATSGWGENTVVGSILVTPAGDGGAPSGLAVFSYQNNGVTVSQAGVPAAGTSTAFRMYEIEGGDYPGQVQTGLAIANPSGGPAIVNLDLTDLSGTETGMSTTLTIPAGGQTAHFMKELISNIPYTFHGVIRITSSANIAVIGLRGDYNTRGDFLITTAMPTDANALATSSEMTFPHLVDGGGYTTEFVIYCGMSSQAGSGVLRFVTQDGQAMNLLF